MQKLLGWLFTLLLVALFLTLVAVRPFVVDVIGMPSEAMAPTVVQDSYVRVDKLGFGIASLTNMVWRYAPPSRVVARGDLIMFRYRGEPMLGRVVALAGDELRYSDDGSIKVNGTPVPQVPVEDPAAAAAGWLVREETLDGRTWRMRLWRTGTSARTSGRRTVASGSVFVLGDSRDQSVDSREIGGIEMDDVLGIVTGTRTEPGFGWPSVPPSRPSTGS